MSLVSVIIPTFNRAHTLGRAIESVLASDYPHFELIVVDDGSSDGTQELLAGYASAGKLKVITRENGGVSAARNSGVRASSGEWIAFLDSDDEWFSHKLRTQLEFAHQHPRYELIHSQEIWIRNGVRVNPRAHHQKLGGDVFKECVQQCFISPSTALLKRSLFEELGGFDERFVVCEDYDLWLRISATRPVGLVEAQLIRKYGGHADQLSTQFFAMDLWRLRALNRLLEEQVNLSSDHVRTASEFIVKQGSILLSGFYKHDNTEHCQEVEEMVIRAKKTLVKKPQM